MMKYSCVFIGVNYRSSEETVKWVESICELNKQNEILIMVIDNSTDSLDVNLEGRIKAINSSLIYLNTGENIGYLPGASKGIKYLHENGIEYSFVVVSNVDLRFKTKNMVDILMSSNKQDVGVFSPAIYCNGKDINPYRINRLTERQMKNRILYLKYPQFKQIVDLIRGIRKKAKQVMKPDYPAGTKMFMTYGACFIFTDLYFKKGGDIDTPLFLYMEEPYVGETNKKLGLNTIYLPQIEIEDIGHVSTGKIASKQHNKILLDAATYIYNSYYNK